ncbi:MAG: homoserine kinase [Rhodothermales bacterium]|nr:homoserine kinase [Rhodothermales bacterium]
MDPERSKATAWAPSSVSNIGPGFDSMGMAVSAWGDMVTVEVERGGELRISYSDDSVWTGATDPDANTASRAAKAVLETVGVSCGLSITIEKRMKAGSGLGSSAASAVAAAVATNHLFGSPLTRHQLIEPSLAGEAVASGSAHGDNVIPCLMGGLVLTDASGSLRYERVPLGEDLILALVVPDIEVLTQDARRLLPEMVPLRDAYGTASRLAMLALAFGRGDWRQAGNLMMSDLIVEPARAELLPFFADVREAALTGGAFGCAISGSGPTMLALCDDAVSAQTIAARMGDAVRASGYDAVILAARPDTTGARVIESTEA